MIKLCKKGTGKASEFEGCYERKKRYKYGLCVGCFQEWVKTTEAGQEYLRSSVIPRAKKDVKVKKQKQKQKAKIDLMSVDQYRKEKLQPVINEIIRIIDYGQPCIAQPQQAGDSAGHFISVGSNRTLSLHAHNIFLQSNDSNGYKGGESLEYYKGLIRVYGESYAQYCDSLKQIQPIKLTKDELIEARKKAMDFKKHLKKNYCLQPESRIKFRNILNTELNIYPKEWQEFFI